MRLWICGILVALVAFGAEDYTKTCMAATNGGPGKLDAVKTMLWNEIDQVVFADSAEHADHYVFYVGDSENQDLSAGLLEELPSFNSVSVLPLSKSDGYSRSSFGSTSEASRYVAFINVELPVMMSSDSCIVNYSVRRGETTQKSMTLVRHYDLWQAMPKNIPSGSGC